MLAETDIKIPKRKAWFLSAVTVLLVSGILLSLLPSRKAPYQGEEPYLHVYNWYGLIPPAVLRQFETETGIQVRYDLYDNNEILEAKLLAGKSGFDLVFPSASPYIPQLIQAGAFQKLDKARLTNLHHLDSILMQKMEAVDPGLTYSIPFYWGTIGFAYVEEIILALMPQAPVKSYQMLFNPGIVAKFSSHGVTLLEEAIDVYPAILISLGKDARSSSLEDLNAAQKQLLKVRPFIARFSGQRFVSEMLSGETCLAQAWSGDALMAALQAQETKPNMTIRYVIPEEGGMLWIDAMCIPRDAPHPENAYKFINFLMRPEISAEITRFTRYPVANVSSVALLPAQLQQDEIMYPPPHVMERLKLDKIQNSTYEEKRTRYWLLARQGGS